MSADWPTQAGQFHTTPSATGVVHTWRKVGSRTYPAATIMVTMGELAGINGMEPIPRDVRHEVGNAIAGVNHALTRHHGVLSRAALVRLGLSDVEIRRLVDQSRLIQIRRGWYASHGAEPDLVSATRARAGLACESAARIHGLWVLRPRHLAPLHMAGARSVSLPGAIVHRTRGETIGQVESVTRAVAHALICLPPLEALCILNSALNKGLVHLADVRHLIRNKPGIDSARMVLQNASAHEDSGLETLAHDALRHAGIPFEPQVTIPGVGRVDSLIGKRLISEMDGRAFHNKPEDLLRDRHRLNAAACLGFITMRHEFEDVWPSPEGYIRDVRAALTSLDHRRS